MPLEVATHAVLALIHRDRHHEKCRAITELLLCRLHPRQQLGADRAPRRPEFDDDRLLADPLRQRHRIAVEVLDRDCGRSLTDWNPNDILRTRDSWQRQPCRYQHRPRRYTHFHAFTRLSFSPDLPGFHKIVFSHEE